MEELGQPEAEGVKGLSGAKCERIWQKSLALVTDILSPGEMTSYSWIKHQYSLTFTRVTSTESINRHLQSGDLYVARRHYLAIL